jgi:hypothetical protein
VLRLRASLHPSFWTPSVMAQIPGFFKKPGI